MTALPQPRPDHGEPSTPCEPTFSAIPGSLADVTRTGPDAPPPHLLWATLESAYAPPGPASRRADEERLAPYIALPLAVGLSLVLWVVIVELVLMR